MNLRTLLLAAAVGIASPAALPAATPIVPIAPATAIASEVPDALRADQAAYAARETAAVDLEPFAGGHDAVYVLLVVVLVVVLLIILL